MLDDAAGHQVVITVEDGVRQGGAGMFVADALRSSMAAASAPPIISLGAPRSFIAQDRPDRILARLGLDGSGLARARAALDDFAVGLHGSTLTTPPPSLPAGMTRPIPR